jgi:hypothetical protein
MARREPGHRTFALLDAGSLEIILCVSVLEHLLEPLRGPADVQRLLRPCGICLVNVASKRGKRFPDTRRSVWGLSPAAEMSDHKAYTARGTQWPLLVRAASARPGRRAPRGSFGFDHNGSVVIARD